MKKQTFLHLLRKYCNISQTSSLNRSSLIGISDVRLKWAKREPLKTLDKNIDNNMTYCGLSILTVSELYKLKLYYTIVIYKSCVCLDYS